MEFLVVTGMSGSGKTQTSNILEDMGYYCIDNMPSAMIPYFAEVYEKTQKEFNVAFVIDVRGESGFESLLREFEGLKKSGFSARMIFIDCEDRVLINRYKESRRIHPLVSLKSISVKEALSLEREMLMPVREKADYIIDTSTLTPLQLKDKLIAIKSGTKSGRLFVTCMSFGYKYGVPLESDLVFDVRCFPNPFYLEELKNKTGLDKEVKEYIFSFDDVNGFCGKLYDMLDYLLPLYENEGKRQLTIAIGCTGGKHRSVAISEGLAEHLRANGSNAITVHRDIIKKFVGDK